MIIVEDVDDDEIQNPEQSVQEISAENELAVKCADLTVTDSELKS